MTSISYAGFNRDAKNAKCANELRTAKKILQQQKRLGGKGPGIKMPSLFAPLQAVGGLLRLLHFIETGSDDGWYENAEDVPPGQWYYDPNVPFDGYYINGINRGERYEVL